MPASRRSFLRGRFKSDSLDIRPPWAVGVDAFESMCTRCGDCVEVCPTHIITIGDGGYPKVDFSVGECTFCADCVSACKPGALRRAKPEDAPWQMKVAIGESCLSMRGVECRVCGECCETSAIRFRPRIGGVAIPELMPERCTGCGACFAPCPVGAISMEMHQ